jgi:phage portal protein BeeE
MTNLLQHSRRGLVWPFPTEAMEGFSYGGSTYFGLAGAGQPNEENIEANFAGLVDGAFKHNAVVFACELKRLSIFSEAWFVYQGFNAGKPGRLFSTPELDILERPWPRGVTGDLLSRMLAHADPGGNAYVARTMDQPDRLRMMRPDWVTIVMGDSSGRPVETAAQLDAEIIGFIYDPKDGQTSPEALTAEEVAHFAPIPDPLARYRGMSWLTPVVREILGDQAATEHKLGFFANGATPQLVVSFDTSVSEEAFQNFVGKMERTHSGWQNAYKTLYLGGGADVTVAGKDLQQLDFSKTQGKGETRIAAASGIHPVIAGLSEGLQGSSLNAGNFNAARRITADTTMKPLWRNACGSLQTIVPPPNSGARLWYDESQIAFLREDAADRAQVQFVKAQTIRQLVEAGFEPASVVAAVDAEDDTLLQHTGLTSVQLVRPGEGDGQTAQTPAEEARNLVEMVQKVYLGVGVVLSAEEARGLLNQAGADLSPGGLRAIAAGNGKPPVPVGMG